MALTIIQTLYLSTAHMTKEDNDLLESGTPNLCVEDTEFGWIIHIDYRGSVDKIHAIKNEGFSKAFVDVLILAWTNRCEWIRFDAEGPKDETIPQFKW
jgi:hypothetical protein